MLTNLVELDDYRPKADMEFWTGDTDIGQDVEDLMYAIEGAQSMLEQAMERMAKLQEYLDNA